MAPSVKSLNQLIFDRLKRVYQDLGGIYDISGNYWISSQVDDRSFISKTKSSIDNQYIYNSRLSFNVLSFEEEVYLVFVGFEPQDFPADTYTLLENNSKFTITALSKLPVPLLRNITGEDIYNDILGLSDRAPDYEGHEFNTISEFFEPFYILKLEQPVDFNIYRGIFDILTLNPRQLDLFFENETLLEYRELLSAICTESLPYGSLIASVLSPRWDTCFLQLYRCVERLISIPQYVEVKRRMSINISLEDFNSIAEEVLGWHPKEYDTLEILIDKTSTSSRTEILKIVDYLPGLGHHTHPAKVFYKARNTIVHGQYEHNAINMSEVSWNILIRSTLMFIKELHNIYINELK